MIRNTVLQITLAICLLFICATSWADPCGMVPPIYNGQGPPITRIGLQKTYVFYKDGVETFVIRPGFSGNVDEFGMLIPFPSVPAIRKTPDNLFDHIVKAIDPPEVVINLYPEEPSSAAFDAFGAEEDGELIEHMIKKQEVRVIKREAVGMYEVAVLAAGSAESLKRWMDDHGFRYPEGMDEVTADYIKQQWCFVAVKTQVAEKNGVDPKPSQRKASGKLKQGSSFDGFVQGMGFRFRTDELVVPMRLSAFNGSDFHNVVYVMTDGPRRIRNIPEEYVVRQISGEQLYKNVTDPLPLRIIGGTRKDLTDDYLRGLKQQRDPRPKNGLARQLFAADLKAIKSDSLALDHEEDEKQLLQIGEHLGLRGAAIDRENAEALKSKAEKITADALKDLPGMTLTIVDGNFPREVLSKQNLTFASFKMPARLNNPLKYDATRFGPGQKKSGMLIQTGMLDQSHDQQIAMRQNQMRHSINTLMTVLGLIAIGMLLSWKRKTRKLQTL